VVLWALLFPGKREVAKAYPDTTEDGLRVRHCQTRAMATEREARVRELRSRRRFFTRGFVARCAVLLLLWCWLVYIALQVRQVLATSARYQNFDPYAILELSSRSSKSSEIKKAFRKLSLKHHPDKSSDPSAAEKFMLVKKAYDALTDPIAKRNYAKYGNPDGPTTMELSVAVPSFSKENQVLVLVLFVFIFILGMPLTLLWCMSGSGQQTCPNGVLRSTMEALPEDVKAAKDARAARELLLACADGAAWPQRAGEEQQLAELQALLAGGSRPAAKKGAQAPAPPGKAEVLFLAHTQRRHDLLNAAMMEDLRGLLVCWRAITLAMADFAARQGLADALTASLELHRCLVQALEPTSGGVSPLLQVPHLGAERLKLWRKGPRKSMGLTGFLELPAEERKASFEGLDLDAQELADIQEFAAVVPRAAITEARVFVEGEDSVCQGDLATLEVTLSRGNLREGEAAGPAHSPHFPGAAVAEAWWLCLSSSQRTMCRRILSPGREVAMHMKFRVPKKGKHRCTVSLLCEAYTGLDLEQTVSFEAKEAPAEADSGEEEEEDNGNDFED